MFNLIQTLTEDCNEYGVLSASCSDSCPANYLKFDECPFNKHCEMIIETDWIKVLKKELDNYLEEE